MMFNNWRKVMPNDLVLTGLVLSSLAIAGCASRGGILGVDCCADIPAGAVPPPAGSKICEWQTAQARAATADQTVLYRADFVANSTRLSPAAVDRMNRLAASGMAASETSLVEPSGDSTLDAQRVAAVQAKLASLGITNSIVQVANAAALGLRGPQAEQAAMAFGNPRNSSAGTGAPVSRPSGQVGTAGALPGGIF